MIIDPYAILTQNMDSGKDEKEIKIEFCKHFLCELKKLKDEELEACLSDVIMDKKKRCVDVIFSFGV